MPPLRILLAEDNLVLHVFILDVCIGQITLLFMMKSVYVLTFVMFVPDKSAVCIGSVGQDGTRCSAGRKWSTGSGYVASHAGYFVANQKPEHGS